MRRGECGQSIIGRGNASHHHTSFIRMFSRVVGRVLATCVVRSPINRWTSLVYTTRYDAYRDEAVFCHTASDSSHRPTALPAATDHATCHHAFERAVVMELTYRRLDSRRAHRSIPYNIYYRFVAAPRRSRRIQAYAGVGGRTQSDSANCQHLSQLDDTEVRRRGERSLFMNHWLGHVRVIRVSLEIIASYQLHRWVSRALGHHPDVVINSTRYY